ncbi:MAG: hypothetical protein R3F61_06400 [Myxococcota bacterium]
MLWLSLALAGPGQSGTLFPGARPLRTPGYAGVGGIVGNVEDRGPAGGAAVDFGVGREVALLGHVHSWGITNGPDGSVAALALRGQLVDTDAVRVAGFVGAALVKEGRLHFVPALAVELGSDKVRFDLTLMPWSVGYRYGTPRWADQQPSGRVRLGETRSRWSHGGIWPLGTIGVAVPLPVGVDDRVRFGFPELMAWHHEGERVYFDVGGVLFGATAGPHAKVGVKLGPRETP